MASEALIRVQHLYRYYGPACALHDVSFELGRGEVLGLLGPNGAGKSTTLQILSGNLAPSAGRVFINGIDLLDEPKRAKAALGYLPEQPPLYRELTVDEYLYHCARLHRIRRERRRDAVSGAKQRCGLSDAGRRLIGNLSKGYQQRIGIAQAILHTPAVVILDEPTVGLDPIQIREIRALIRELSKEHSVILSTHLLPEAQTVCSRVQIIHQGRLVFSDTVAGLDRRMRPSSLVTVLHQPPAVAELEALPGVRAVEPLQEGRFRLHYRDGEDPVEALAERAAACGWGLRELTPERVSLEHIFLELTCKEESATADPAPREAAA